MFEFLGLQIGRWGSQFLPQATTCRCCYDVSYIKIKLVNFGTFPLHRQLLFDRTCGRSVNKFAILRWKMKTGSFSATGSTQQRRDLDSRVLDANASEALLHQLALDDLLFPEV